MPRLHDVLVLTALTAFTALAGAQTDATTAEQLRLERLFATQMSGCRMVGRFTIDGSDGPAQPEQYTLGKVEKVRDEKWRVEAKIEFDGKSATVPLQVDVFWAGDTPMIQVTRLLVPTLGTYSARVLIHGDRYAGTWSGKDHGGHMFGRIERADKEEEQDKQKVGALSPQEATAKWPKWRGPAGSGEVPDGAPPVTWSENENIVWKTPLPGLGNSTPVIWGDRMFLTTAVEPEGAGFNPEPAGDGRRGGGMNHPKPDKPYEFRVLAVDRHSGDVVWSKTVARTTPHEGGHKTGSHASNSPVTDGRLLFAHFGSRGVHCLTLDGELVWSRDLGRMQTRNQFGEGSSPALVDDKLIVAWDHEGDSFVAALDAKTGEDVWRVPRDEVTSWSTPVIAEVDDRKQAIISATGASRAYDVESGEVIWSCTGMTVNSIPTPIVRDGVAWLMSGFRGAMLQAVRLSGAKGDITDTEHVLWSHKRQTSYVPSGLLYGEELYFLRSNSGVLSCVDAATGQVHYEGQRLSGIRSVYASPIGVAGRIYLPSREGTIKVLKAGTTFEELATNQLDDMFDASPIVIGDRLYLRGHEHLYCIGGS